MTGRQALDQIVRGLDGVTLTLDALQRAHIERQEEWCPDQKPDLSFRGNEMAGETGEACNVIKKLERERHGWRGSRATVEQLGDELADVIHTAVLCAITAGIDLQSAVIAKFNSTSEKNGLSTLITGSSDAESRATAAEATATALTEALEPFARAADNRAKLALGPDIDHWTLGHVDDLTLGDLRRASKALSQIRSEK